MFAKVFSGALVGIDGALVEVEVHITGKKLPRFVTVGLPEGAVKESKERVQAAVRNTNFIFPNKHITVNLAPADLRKEGAAYDLPIAIGILSAIGEVENTILSKCMILGELSLNGRIRKIKGVLSLVLAARKLGLESVILPEDNAEEGRVVSGINVVGLSHLSQVVELLNKPHKITELCKKRKVDIASTKKYILDFFDVKGQVPAKRAMEVAAAGGHNVLMIGPPGSGKTMIAKRLPTILPEMSIEESLETTKVYSVAGLLLQEKGLLIVRPFRSPHHTISDVGLIGGGQFPKPGEVSLAHNGVLFLDELPEFKKNVLEVLRQPIEDGYVNVSRAMMSICFPAKFMLVCAMNPCPCGFITDPKHDCTCSNMAVQKYLGRISGPLFDRMDIHVEVPAVPFKELTGISDGDTSDQIRKRVRASVKIQNERFSETQGVFYNSQMESTHLRKFCKIKTDAELLLEKAIEKLGLSARAYDRILKVSRTIADLDQEVNINSSHISEAIHYRSLDRQLWK